MQPEAYFANGFSSVLTFLSQVESYLMKSAALARDASPYPEPILDEAKWRIPIGDHEMITAASSTCRRATTASVEGFHSLVQIAGTYDEITKGPGNSDQQAAVAMLAMKVMEEMNKFSLYLVMLHTMQGRRPFLSQNGLVGLGPNGMQSDDLVIIFFGCHTPFVIRPDGKGTYRLIGEAYVHGIMDGEIVKPQQEDTVFSMC